MYLGYQRERLWFFEKKRTGGFDLSRERVPIASKISTSSRIHFFLKYCGRKKKRRRRRRREEREASLVVFSNYSPLSLEEEEREAKAFVVVRA